VSFFRWSLFRGTESTLQAVAVSNFVYFYLFHGLKRLSGQEAQSAGGDVIFACAAGNGGEWGEERNLLTLMNPPRDDVRSIPLFLPGVGNVLLTNPLWVVNTRLKAGGGGGHGHDHGHDDDDDANRIRGLLGTKKNLPTSISNVRFFCLDGLLKILHEEGVPALWSGTWASVALVSNPAIKFTVYEALKRRLLALRGEDEEGSLQGGAAFLVGVLASVAATAATYPLQIVQAESRVRAESSV